jgi:hypothetical protein
MRPGLLESMGRSRLPMVSQCYVPRLLHAKGTRSAPVRRPLRCPKLELRGIPSATKTSKRDTVSSTCLSKDNLKERDFVRSKILRFRFLVYDQCSCRRIRLYLYSWSSGCFPRPLLGLYLVQLGTPLSCHWRGIPKSY